MQNNTNVRKPDPQLHMSYSHKNAWIAAALILTATVLLSWAASSYIASNMAVRYENDIRQRYYFIQDEMEDLIDMGENLVIGYRAFFISSDEVTDDESYSYFSSILKGQEQFIRNIGIIKDTTIIYNYPLEGNESTIGVDLASLPNQRDAVLNVKNNLVTGFHGPIDLIQGGIGYIIRVPILDVDNHYWGQASVVLNADAIHDRIIEIADIANLDILVFSDETMENPIIGSYDVMDKNPVEYHNVNNYGWVILAASKDTAYLDQIRLIQRIIILGICALGAAAAFLYVRSDRAKYRLKRSMAHDQLTDLYNRWYLEIIENDITATNDIMKYGLFLIDLDNFKYINDNFSHNEGDLLLKTFSYHLKHISRKNELVF